MIGKNDIADFCIDYKKDDWIRAIIDLKNKHLIVIRWDCKSQTNAMMAEEMENPVENVPSVEESWTLTTGDNYNNSERETILTMIETADNYKKLVEDWPFAAEIIHWKSKHPETTDSELPPPDQYFGVH